MRPAPPLLSGLSVVSRVARPVLRRHIVLIERFPELVVDLGHQGNQALHQHPVQARVHARRIAVLGDRLPEHTAEHCRHQRVLDLVDAAPEHVGEPHVDVEGLADERLLEALAGSGHRERDLECLALHEPESAARLGRLPGRFALHVLQQQFLRDVQVDHLGEALHHAPLDGEADGGALAVDPLRLGACPFCLVGAARAHLLKPLHHLGAQRPDQVRKPAFDDPQARAHERPYLRPGRARRGLRQPRAGYHAGLDGQRREQAQRLALLPREVHESHAHAVWLAARDLRAHGDGVVGCVLVIRREGDGDPGAHGEGVGVVLDDEQGMANAHAARADVVDRHVHERALRARDARRHADLVTQPTLPRIHRATLPPAAVVRLVHARHVPARRTGTLEVLARHRTLSVAGRPRRAGAESSRSRSVRRGPERSIALRQERFGIGGGVVTSRCTIMAWIGCTRGDFRS